MMDGIAPDGRLLYHCLHSSLAWIAVCIADDLEANT